MSSSSNASRCSSGTAGTSPFVDARMVGPGPDDKERLRTTCYRRPKMFSNHKTLRTFRRPPRAMHARAHEKEISFALVPTEEAKARGAAGRTGPGPDRRSTCTEAPEVEAPEQPATTGEEAPKTTRRRRGSRGGRNRRKPARRPAARRRRRRRKSREAQAAGRRSSPSGGRRSAAAARSGQRRRVATKRAPASAREARARHLGRHRRAAGRRPRGRPGRRGLPRAPRTPLDRRQHLQGEGRQRPPRHGGRIRRDRPREERVPVRRRDRRPRAGGQGRSARSRT